MQVPIEFTGGRFGNRFFGNMALHFLSQVYRLPIKYSRAQEFEELGLRFHKEEPRVVTDPTSVMITDPTLMDHIVANDCSGDYTINVSQCYFQTKGFALHMADYFAKPEIQRSIREANPFRSRYKTNRSVFVHVRLGDMMHNHPSKEYFKKALASIAFEDGYIASVTSYHPLVQELAAEYRLTVVRDTEVRTIQFASTCTYQVLSQGTFSFMMGLLGFDTELVQWPQIKQAWHGDIFVIPAWREVEW